MPDCSFGLLRDQAPAELVPVEPQGRGVGAAPDGRHPGPAFEQPELAELRPRVQHVERDLLAPFALLAHPGPARRQDVEGIGLVPLPDDLVAEAVARFGERGHQPLALALGNELDERGLLEYVPGIVAVHGRDSRGTVHRTYVSTSGSKYWETSAGSRRASTCGSSMLGGVLSTTCTIERFVLRPRHQDDLAPGGRQQLRAKRLRRVLEQERPAPPRMPLPARGRYPSKLSPSSVMHSSASRAGRSVGKRAVRNPIRIRSSRPRFQRRGASLGARGPRRGAEVRGPRGRAARGTTPRAHRFRSEPCGQAVGPAPGPFEECSLARAVRRIVAEGGAARPCRRRRQRRVGRGASPAARGSPRRPPRARGHRSSSSGEGPYESAQFGRSSRVKRSVPVPALELADQVVLVDVPDRTASVPSLRP